MLRRRVWSQHAPLMKNVKDGSMFYPVRTMTTAIETAKEGKGNQAVKMKIPPYFWLNAAKMLQTTLSELIEKEREEAGAISKFVWEKVWNLEEGPLLQGLTEMEQKEPGTIKSLVSSTKAEIEHTYRTAKMMEERLKSLEKKLVLINGEGSSIV